MGTTDLKGLLDAMHAAVPYCVGASSVFVGLSLSFCFNMTMDLFPGHPAYYLALNIFSESSFYSV